MVRLFWKYTDIPVEGVCKGQAALLILYQSAVTDVHINASCVSPGSRSHLRKTVEKKPLNKETTAKLQQSEIWKIENEFYEFALEQFQFVRAHAVREKDGELYILDKSFVYEKIHPKGL